MFAQRRWREAHLHRGGGYFEGRGDQLDWISPGLSRLDDHLARQHLGVAQGMVDRVDRPKRHPGCLQERGPVGDAGPTEQVFQQRDEGLTVLHPVGVGPEASIIRPIRLAGPLTELSPLPIVADGEGEIPVVGSECLVGYDVGVGIAETPRGFPRDQVVAGNVRQPGHLAVEQRDIDSLSPAAAGVVEEGRQDGVASEQPSGDVGDRHAHLVRLTFLRPGDAHHPTLGLDDEIVPGQVPVRSGVTITGDRAVDETRSQALQRLVAHAPLLQCAHPEVLDQHIALLYQLL